MPKDILRAQYTTRMLEIVKNIHKQNVEINKVLLDTRAVQKEIATSQDTLNRTYAATDQLIYQVLNSFFFSSFTLK